jgi:predicted dinucleotide-binding enzyme
MIERRSILAAGAAVILGDTAMAQSNDKTVAIIGTGRMGGAFGAAFGRLGYKVIYGSRNPTDEKIKAVVAKTAGASAASPKDAAAAAGIVVIATPWNATEATIKSLGDLSGKLVLDPTNAISFSKDGAGMAAEASGGELVRDWAKGAKVVKAFNTVGFFVIADPETIDGKVACFIAGDDEAAKAQATEIVTAMGFEAVDVGAMKAARVLEGMSTLYMVPYLSGKQDQRFEWAVRRSGGVKLGPVRPAG